MRRDVFQAIADPTRRAIIHMLSSQDLNLNSVAEQFDVSRPAISKHIKILTECGLITIRQEGRERYCEVKLKKLNEVSEWVEQYKKFWNQKLDSLEMYLEEIQSKQKKSSSVKAAAKYKSKQSSSAKASEDKKKKNETKKVDYSLRLSVGACPDDRKDVKAFFTTETRRKQSYTEKKIITRYNMNATKEFIFERTLKAPLDLVWKLHTEAEHLEKWWGPVGLKTTRKKMEFKPGGVFHFRMQGDDGFEMWAKFIYREISPKTHFSFVLSFADENGNAIKYKMAPDWPMEVLNTISFEAIGNETKVILRAHPINALPVEIDLYNNSFESMNGGFGSSYGELVNYLKTI